MSTAPRFGLFDGPTVRSWACGGYVSASSFSSVIRDPKRGLITLGQSSPVTNVALPSEADLCLPEELLACGAVANQNDRDNFNHSKAQAMVLHDMPRHDNRVDRLAKELKDAWGILVATVLSLLQSATSIVESDDLNHFSRVDGSGSLRRFVARCPSSTPTCHRHVARRREWRGPHGAKSSLPHGVENRKGQCYDVATSPR